MILNCAILSPLCIQVPLTILPSLSLIPLLLIKQYTGICHWSLSPMKLWSTTPTELVCMIPHVLNVELLGARCASYPSGSSIATPSGIIALVPSRINISLLAYKSIQFPTSIFFNFVAPSKYLILIFTLFIQIPPIKSF